MTQPTVDDQDRSQWRRRNGRDVSREPFDPADIPNLAEAETRLRQLEHELAELDIEQAAAEAAMVQAQVNWERLLGVWTLVLHNQSSRSSEDLRRAFTFDKLDPKTNQRGIDLYATLLATRSVRDTLARSMKLKETEVSSIQTRVRGLRERTGLHG